MKEDLISGKARKDIISNHLDAPVEYSLFSGRTWNLNLTPNLMKFTKIIPLKLGIIFMKETLCYEE